MDHTKYCPLNLNETHACYRNKYTTDDTMALRTLRDILEQVKMDPEAYLEMVKTHMFIHPQVSMELTKILENVKTFLQWTQDEHKLVTKALSSDYNNRKDVENMADLLTRTVCDQDSVRRLNMLFAVDGFVTELNYKHYVDSLKTQLFEDTRDFRYDEFGMFVLAVRSFYKQFENATPLMVHKAACEIMENKKREDLTPEAAFLMDRFGNWVERVKEKVIRKKIDDELKQVFKPMSNPKKFIMEKASTSAEREAVENKVLIKENVQNPDILFENPNKNAVQSGNGQPKLEIPKNIMDPVLP